MLMHHPWRQPSTSFAANLRTTKPWSFLDLRMNKIGNLLRAHGWLKSSIRCILGTVSGTRAGVARLNLAADKSYNIHVLGIQPTA